MTGSSGAGRLPNGDQARLHTDSVHHGKQERLAVHIVDLTAELHDGLPVYPGDPPVVVAPAAAIETHGYALARLALSDQSGTHVETQAHFLAHGRTLAEEPLERFIGPAVVVDVPCRCVTVADLAPARDWIAGHARVLLRSGYRPAAGRIDPNDPARPRLDLDALHWLLEQGVQLLGIDAFDFDAAADCAGHRLLLEQGVLIVEGLVNLEALPRVVQLFVAPLRLRGTGAAPCRAFAIVD
jgi:kynurenine formamidase